MPHAAARALRRRRRGCRGQAIIESVAAIMLLCLIFFAVMQIAMLYMAQMIIDHTASVTARSYVVGFEEPVVRRASQVGSIPMAGHLEYPDPGNLTLAQQGAMEPMLIEEFLSQERRNLDYQHWPRITTDLPVLGGEGMATIRIDVHNYPLEMPMHRAYMRSDTIDFGSSVRLYNHAGFYLE